MCFIENDKELKIRIFISITNIAAYYVRLQTLYIKLVRNLKQCDTKNDVEILIANHHNECIMRLMQSFESSLKRVFKRQ